MTSKQLIYVSMFLGSIIGGWILTLLWDAGMFDLSVLFATAIGGALGIYFGWKISQSFV